MKNKKQWKTTNNDKWQTTNNDKQQTTTNDKHNYFVNAHHESWSPWYLDFSDQLNHSDNPDWSLVNLKDNRRIRIVYFVLFGYLLQKKMSLK